MLLNIKAQYRLIQVNIKQCRSDNFMKSFLSFLLFLTFAQSQIFGGYGRNKIQYNNFEWHVLQTKHFDVYYYPEMQDLAEKGAFEAEKAYEKYSKNFNHVIKRKIPLIFYSTHVHFQQTNITPGFIPEGVGGFFEFLKGRVVIPGNGNVNQFLKVIRHELVHVFMHDMLNRLHREHGSISNIRPPLWYTEGLAEFYSNKWDYNGEMIMKDAVLNNYLPLIDQLFQISGSYMMYKVGENILRFIANTYGEEKVMLLLANVWKYPKFSDVIQQTLGMSQKELSDKWMYSLKKRYYPLLQNYDFADAVSVSVEKNGYNFKPIYSEADSSVIFWSNRSGYTGIYKKKLELLDKADDEDDIELLLTGEQSGDFESFSIYSNGMDINTRNELIFSSKSQGAYQLYVMDLTTNQIVKEIRLPDSLVSVNSPSWSNDNVHIAFSGLLTSGYRDIFTFNTKTYELNGITSDFYEDNDPSWSPDGLTIVFSSDRGAYGKEWAYNLFAYDLASKNIRYLTYGKQHDLVPKVSPNGDYVTYVSTENSEKNIYIVPLKESTQLFKPIKLSMFTSSVSDVDWISSDELVFTVFNKRRLSMHRFADVALRSREVEERPISDLDAHSQWQLEKIAQTGKDDIVLYEDDYELDFAVSQVSQDPTFGTTGGALLGFSDLFGNKRYNILVYNNATTSDDLLKSFSFKLSKYELGERVNTNYGIYRFAGRRYDLRDYYYEDVSGADFLMSYPVDQYNRYDVYTSFQYSERSYDFTNVESSWVASAHISYVKDNSLWGATGPVEGDRFKVSVGYSKDVVYNNASFYTLLGDFRKYFRTGQRTTFAVRLMGLATKGKQSRFYGLGGSWDLRGYDFLRIRGDHLFLLSQEFRFPLFDFLGFKISYGPAIGSNYINGALFYDLGNAFEDQFVFSELKNSYGVGVRVNMFGALVLRFDFGQRKDLNKNNSEDFSRFFFGWDF